MTRTEEDDAAVHGGSSSGASQTSRASSHDADVFRDSLFRYCGYSNELGEAFKYHISGRMYKASYAIASMYVLGDAVDKALVPLSKGGVLGDVVADRGESAQLARWRSLSDVTTSQPQHREDPDGVDGGSTLWRAAGIAFADTLCWQAFASVIVPGVVINRAVWATQRLVGKSTHTALGKWLPTIVGLGLIPLIGEFARGMRSDRATEHPSDPPRRDPRAGSQGSLRAEHTHPDASSIQFVRSLVHPIDTSVDWAMDKTVRAAASGAAS